MLAAYILEPRMTAHLKHPLPYIRTFDFLPRATREGWRGRSDLMAHLITTLDVLGCDRRKNNQNRSKLDQIEKIYG